MGGPVIVREGGGVAARLSSTAARAQMSFNLEL